MKLKSDIRILNKKAKFEYIILDRYTAGIQLFGTEIKSIREGKASLVDSYCAVEHGEMYVKQMHIAEYRFGSYANHEAKRDRKLLLQRREIRKLEKATRIQVRPLFRSVCLSMRKDWRRWRLRSVRVSTPTTNGSRSGKQMIRSKWIN